jgi:hypothetical protein
MGVVKLDALAWPTSENAAQQVSAHAQTLIVDLRDIGADTDTLSRLTDLSQWCVREFARRSQTPMPLAIVVCHPPAGSGRTSATLFAELALCGVRAFVRQMRYDRMWKDTPLTFIDARDASDEEISDTVGTLLRGTARIDVDRSSGATAGAHWKTGDSL